MAHFYHGAHVLVTGGAGFIGSHIIEQLLALGAYVTVLDNLTTGSLENIAPFKDAITFIHGDINDLSACVQAAQNKKVIFHLAAQVSVPESMQNPHACHATNVMGTTNVLEAARLCAVERVIFSSSSAVYGVQEGPCSESTPCAPTSAYGHSKYMGELLCAQYAQLFNVGTVCLRYFNVHGKRQNPNGAYAAVVAKFNYAMAHNIPITMFGDGTQTRDFIAVEHVAQANIMLGALPRAQLTGQVFNIGTGKSITINELFGKLKQNYPDYPHAAQYSPARAGDIAHSSADCSKFKAVLKNNQYLQ